MNQERAKQFMRDFDKVFEKLRDTTGSEEINELKEYFVNEYPEIFHVECALEEVNEELERIVKHDKKIKTSKKHCSLSPGFWQSFISIEVCRDCIPALASSCKKQLTGFFVCLLFFLKVKRIS